MRSRRTGRVVKDSLPSHLFRWRPELLRLEDRLAPATMSPDQVRHAYGFDAIPKFGGLVTADGAGQTIAIVDAFNNPNIVADLAFFDSTYGTSANQLNARPASGANSFFRVVNQTGGSTLPSNATGTNASWATEIALDVQWAHAIAPMADVVLVECNTATMSDLGRGVAWAAANGASVISCSWGQSEFSGEITTDSTYFVNLSATGSPGVAILFSAGDDGLVSYPSASRNVLSVGATNLSVTAGENWSSEVAWSFSGTSGGGGGKSGIENRPPYQNLVQSVVGTKRGTPDVSIIGGSGSPVRVYDTFGSGGWTSVWGTSAACPMWAGLVALVDQGRSLAGLQPLNTPVESQPAPNPTSYQLQSNLYALASNPAYYATDFHDVTSGSSANNSALAGYDLVTGWGSPVANKLVPDLVGYSNTAVSVGTPAPTAFGPIQLTATVSGPLVAPTGLVDFRSGATDLGTAALSGGTATLTLPSSPLAVGPDAVTAYYLGDANYTTSNGSTTVTVAAADTNTTLAASQSAVAYGQTEKFTATVAGVAGHTPTGSIHFRLGGTDLGTVALSNGVAVLTTTALPAGSPDTVTADYVGDSNYAASSGSRDVVVTPADLTVTAADGSMVYGAAVPDLTYTYAGLVNGDVIDSVLTGGPATAATPASGVGNYPITRGTLAVTTANYDLTFVSGTLSVARAPLAIFADAATRLYGAALPPPTFTASGFRNGDTEGVLTGALGSTAGVASGVGTYAITLGTLDAANYLLSFTGNTLTVTPAPLNVTADSATKGYGAAVPTLTFSTSGLVNGDTPDTALSGALATTATASSGVAGSPYPITNGTLSAANYTITFTGNGLAVTKAPLTVTASPASKPYGVAVPTLGYTASGFVLGDTPAALSGSLTTSATAASGVGTYPVTIGTLSAANYTVTFVGSLLTVTPVALSVTADAIEKVYGAAVPALTASFGGFVNGDTPASAVTGTLTTTATASTDVGLYPISLGTLAAANYTVTFTGSTLSVTPAALIVTADAETKEYGAEVPPLSYGVEGLVNGDTAADVLSGTLGTSATATSAVGTYPITLGTLASSTNYDLSFVGDVVTVVPTTLVVSADPLTAVYGAALPAPTFSVSGLLAGDTVGSALSGRIAINATAGSGVGTYSIGRGSLTATSNYTLVFHGNSLTVTPAALSVTADSLSKRYGAAVPSLSFTADGFVNGDDASTLSGSLATTATASSAVGTYPIIKGSLAAVNYSISFTGGALAVTPATLSVTAANAAKDYGAPLPPLTLASVTGLVNGDTPASALTGTLATAATASSSVGDYPIRQGSLAAANYRITFTVAILHVNRVPLTISAEPATKQYGAAVPALSFTATGLVGNDTIQTALIGNPDTTGSSKSNVGDYPITVGTLAAANYTISFTPNRLTVTPATLSVDVHDATGLTGVTLPPFTFDVTGLVNGDGTSVLTGMTLSTPATLLSPTGRYPITATGGAAANYTVTTRAGVLTLTSSANLLGTTGYAVGADAGGAPLATLYRADGTPRFTVTAFDPFFTGGVRVAAADFNGDGTPDLVAGTGPGTATLVRVIDGVTGSELFRIEPFEAAFTGGVYVTTGDLGGDGEPELVVTPDQGGGPRVEVYRFPNGTAELVSNFFGIDDPNFRGGARAAVGDLTGDGRVDLVVAAGFGGGPRVTAFDGRSVGSAGGLAPLFNLFVFEQGLRNGVFVTAGDIDGDGRADLVVGGGPGGGPRVLALSGGDLVSQTTPRVLANFFAGTVANRGGVRVAVKNLDGDALADLVVGDGTGAGSRVTAYVGTELITGPVEPGQSFDAFAGFRGGVFVG